MRKAGLLVGVVVSYLAGCYQPAVRDCTVKCSAPTDCTGGQICRADGWCALPDVKDCPKQGHDDSDATADAAGGSGNDSTSNSLCEQGCGNGHCVEGVCVIDCGTPYACQNDVMCPANLPCRVVCGEHSCAKHIVCGLASSCEVQCTGDYSCGDEIQCNTHRCDVDCTGISSCKRRTRCANACACDVACTGAGSCVEVSECPALTCRLGNGCSAQLAGCDDC